METVTTTSEGFSIGDPLLIGVAVLGILAALLVGHLWGRGGRRVLIEEARELESKLSRAENQITEQNRRIAKMRGERDTIQNLALSLPEVVRDLNRADLHPDDVPRLIYTLAASIFQPEQLLLYYLGRDKVQQRTALKLSYCHGLDAVPKALDVVQVGEGKIGWVARQQLDMLPDDWKKVVTAGSEEIRDNHAALRADIIGPLVTRGGSENSQVIGVLCIGNPQVRPRDVKLMFQMVTNFGSMAVTNARIRAKLASQADHDGLTKLNNKRSFLTKQAPQLLMDCENKAQPFSIFIFDIDHFKKFNDGNGHPAGDRLLARMGEIIRKHLRPGDIACRYGGEEFVIAMPNTTKEDAHVHSEKLRAKVQAEPFEFADKQPLGFVSISGGIAASPRDGSEVGVLIQHADEALYQGKQGGRNRLSVYQGTEIGASDPVPVGASS